MRVKIWAPPARDVKSNAAVGIALTVVLAMALTVGAVVLFVKYDLGAYFLLICVVAITALCMALAVSMGRRVRRSTLIFCLDDERRLFFIDANKYADYHRGLAGYAAMQREAHRAVQTLCAPGGMLERYMAEPKSLVGLEPEIMAVERLREKREHAYITCRAKYPNGRVERAKIMLVHGYEDEDLLCRELERLQVPEL